ncbi:MAG: glycosyltransferase family 1 protein [Lachnospiraceae bacterium]|nr:glycosyltransferase family 1 protein [Lachnospiraceae bacterium]
MKTNLVEIGGKNVRLLKQHRKNPDYCTEKQQVFIIGSKGIPANYGGFETFVEKLTEYQVSNKIHYHVACMADNNLRFEYNGAKCFNIKVPNIGPAKAIYYDIAALKQCIEYCKARPSITRPIFYVLACRIGPFIGHYKKEIEDLGGVLYVNPDGHEWKRAKWSAPVRQYWKLSEKLMVKHADLLICDSKSIEKYIQHDYKKYNPETTFIAYGSDTKPSSLKDDDENYQQWLSKHGLQPKSYYLVVGRFVPENNYETMIKEFMRSKTKKSFALITNVSDKFLNELKEKTGFDKDKRIKFVGTVYEQELLKKVRENAYGYFHGHEVGGTNPSLLEALGSTELNLLLDVGFNNEVGENAALYWSKEEGNLAALIEKADQLSREEIKQFGIKAKRRIAKAYSWEKIVDSYETVFEKGAMGQQERLPEGTTR